MNGKAEAGIFLALATILVVFVYVRPSSDLIVYYITEVFGLFFIGLFSAALLYYQVIQPFKRRLELTHRKNEEIVLSEKNLLEKQNQRQKVQEDYMNDVLAYQEIQNRKREEALRKKEQEFYRFTNPVFNSKGQKVEIDSAGDHRQCADVNKDAATRRRIVEPPVTASITSAEIKQKKIERVRPALPEEPAENNPESVTISFRTPQNRIHKRRFLTSTTVEILHSFMSSIGYNPLLYQLRTPYPQTPITGEPSTTLLQLGITKHSLLAITRMDE